MLPAKTKTMEHQATAANSTCLNNLSIVSPNSKKQVALGLSPGARSLGAPPVVEMPGQKNSNRTLFDSNAESEKPMISIPLRHSEDKFKLIDHVKMKNNDNKGPPNEEVGDKTLVTGTCMEKLSIPYSSKCSSIRGSRSPVTRVKPKRVMKASPQINISGISRD